MPETGIENLFRIEFRQVRTELLAWKMVEDGDFLPQFGAIAKRLGISRRSWYRVFGAQELQSGRRLAASFARKTAERRQYREYRQTDAGETVVETIGAEEFDYDEIDRRCFGLG